MVTRGNGRPDWRSPPIGICMCASLWAGDNVALFQRQRMLSSPDRVWERLGDGPKMETYMPPLGLGGKVDAVRAAGQGRAGRQQTEQPNKPNNS